MRELILWLQQKWQELINRFRTGFVIRVARKSVEMNSNEGEARLWGDKETVREVAHFYEQFKGDLITVVEIRRLTGKNTATGFLDDMRRCYAELENERIMNSQREQKKQTEEAQKKRRDILKRAA